MRILFFINVLLCNSYFFFGQSTEEALTNIKDQLEIIDSYIESDAFHLEPEEFLDKMADHGAELNGYYEHERLKKIIRKVGTPRADVITVFYFWNDQLIYVNYKQRPYVMTTNEFGQKIPDYSKAYTKYEAKRFFKNGKVIKKQTIGSSIKEIHKEERFVSYANKMKALLDNKFYNRDTYSALQGKWLYADNIEDYIIFEGTIRFNFYNGKFANRLKTRIEDGVLICFFPMDNKNYRYRILDLKSDVLILEDLSSKEEFVYAKLD